MDIGKQNESDVASAIVDDIVSDLTSRSGLQNAFEECDPDIQYEIKAIWTEIVKKHITSFLLDM